jgi:cobalt-zinc-cadmium efflux system outer membrane protein
MILARNAHIIGILLVAAVPKAYAQQTNVISQTAREIPAQEFHDATSGLTSTEIVRRALSANLDLTASRLDVERARGRLRQAGLFPNPTFDIGHSTGRWTGSPDEKEQSIGVTVPIELGGKRGRRLDVAQAEFEAAQAEVAERERRLTGEVRLAHAEALAALRELDVTSDLIAIDQQTVQFVQNRVTEGDAPPLELNLLRAETDRLRSRRALVQGRLEGAVQKLKSLASFSASEPVRFREDLASVGLPGPASLEQSLQLAIATRPDLKLARLNEEVAAAGLRLARAQTIPDLIVFSKYSVNRSSFDNTPIGVLRDRDKLFSFGASISIPILNRNQGAKLEAQAAITQARQRREFIEASVRAEVTSAYSRYQGARTAAGIYEQGVVARSTDNVRAVRGAYEIGALRITDLLAEQRRQVDYQREYTDALAESYRALADLNAAIATPANP